MAQANKDYIVAVYFQAKTQYRRPSDILCKNTNKDWFREVVDRVVYEIGWQTDMDLQAKMAGLQTQTKQMAGMI